MRAVKFLQPDHYRLLRTRLLGLRMDYGPAFKPMLEEADGKQARLTFHSCLYSSVFKAERAPDLTRFACCLADRLWLEGGQYKGVNARLTSAISNGDDACCFLVERVGT